MPGADLAPGIVFAGDSRIERPLARGGMGAVWIAEPISTVRRRALELMRAEPCWAMFADQKIGSETLTKR